MSTRNSKAAQIIYFCFDEIAIHNNLSGNIYLVISLITICLFHYDIKELFKNGSQRNLPNSFMVFLLTRII